MNSRRHFIQRCSGALLGAAVAPTIGLSVGSRRLASFTAFSRQVDTAFSMVTEMGKVSLVLAKAQPYHPKNKPELADHRNFTLQFVGSGSTVSEQGTYTFQHSALGEMDLFVVPNIEPVTGRINYIASFYGAAVA